MTEIIKIEISGRTWDDIKKWLQGIQRGFKSKAMNAFTEYIIGNESHGLKHEPAYKYVSRKKAYGVTFFSDKQRKWFFAALNDGRIKPGVNNRTGLQSNSWAVKGENTTRQTIYNTAPGSRYTMGNRTQANQPRLVGWRKISDVVSSNMKGAIRYAQQKVNKWIKEGYR